MIDQRAEGEGRHPPPTGPGREVAAADGGGRRRYRPLVVVAIEPVSLEWFHDAVLASLRRTRDRRGPRPRIVRIGLRTARSARRLARRRSRPAIIIGRFGLWLYQIEDCDLLYLRPGVLGLRDILPGVGGGAESAAAMGYLDEVDGFLARDAVISLECLFHEPTRAALCLKTRFGLDLDPQDFARGREAQYRRALGYVLQIVERGPLADNRAMLSFSVGETYATKAQCAGLLALRDGWSWPESEHTWSDGERAVLLIPLAAAGRGDRLCLRLDGMLPPEPVALRILADGQLLLTLEKREIPPRDQTITLMLPRPHGSDPVLAVELQFSNTFCPREAGYSSDPRRLGFALRSFTVFEETLLAAGLRSLIQWRSPGVTLALTQPPDSSRSLGRMLAQSGLSGSLIALTEAPAAAGLAQHEGHPGDLPDLPPISAPGVGDAPAAASSAEARAASRSAAPLRTIAFAGTLATLLDDLGRRAARLDLIVLSTAELFGEVLDALAPVVAALPQSLPDLAICSADAAIFNRAYWHHRTSYEQLIPRFAAATVGPRLISFTGRIT